MNKNVLTFCLVNADDGHFAISSLGSDSEENFLFSPDLCFSTDSCLWCSSSLVLNSSGDVLWNRQTQMQTKQILNLTTHDRTSLSLPSPTSVQYISTIHKNQHNLGLFLQPTLMHNSITTRMLHYYPRHVSGLDMPILRRNNCTNTASGILALLSGCTLHRLREDCSQPV